MAREKDSKKEKEKKKSSFEYSSHNLQIGTRLSIQRGRVDAGLPHRRFPHTIPRFFSSPRKEKGKKGGKKEHMNNSIPVAIRKDEEISSVITVIEIQENRHRNARLGNKAFNGRIFCVSNRVEWKNTAGGKTRAGLPAISSQMRSVANSNRISEWKF